MIRENNGRSLSRNSYSFLESYLKELVHKFKCISIVDLLKVHTLPNLDSSTRTLCKERRGYTMRTCSLSKGGCLGSLGQLLTAMIAMWVSFSSTFYLRVFENYIGIQEVFACEVDIWQVVLESRCLLLTVFVYFLNKKLKYILIRSM